ncbi:MAG TPA: O-antigen ligase family protein [Rhodocyclaceae bacterium]
MSNTTVKATLRDRISQLVGSDGWPASLSSWLLAFSLIMAPNSEFEVALHISYGDVLVMAAVFAALIERAVRGERMPVLPRLYVALCLLVTSYLLNNATDVRDERGSFFTIVTMMVVFPQAFLFVRLGNANQVRFMIYAWTLGCLAGALFAIAYCNGYFPSHSDAFWYYNHRARGLTPHPNRLGLVCFLGVPGVLLLLSESRSLLGRSVALVGLAILLKALDYSGSRAGTIAAVIIIVMWGVLLTLDSMRTRSFRHGAFARAVVIGAISALALGAYGALTGRGIPIIQGTIDRLLRGDKTSDSTRSWLNDRAMDQFFTSPLFGEGFQWFGVYDPAVAHNLYLQYLSAAGIAGLVVLLMIVAYPLAAVLKYQIRLRDRASIRLNTVLLASGTGLLVWLWPQSGFTAYEGLVYVCITTYVAVWRIYERPTTESADRAHRSPDSYAPI